MRINILIGGKAGQGINKVSEIVSGVLNKYGYFTFNHRDYPSLIRGGHNFNVLSVSDERVGSIESKLDIILALDEKTAEIHKKDLKKNGILIKCDKFCDIGRNLNITLAGMLIKILGIPIENFIEEIKTELGKDNNDAINAGKTGYNEEKSKFNLKKLNNKIENMNGSEAISVGAINSEVNLYLGYPMTPATNVLHELASREFNNSSGRDLMVFEPENEIAVANAAIGASFAGAKVMIGTAGGGYDLMTEALSFQGMAEIPLVVYLATRPGPGTGVPTYSSQADLDIALRGGHGEFPRIVIAPGDPIECIEKTNEAFYLSEKYKIPHISTGEMCRDIAKEGSELGKKVKSGEIKNIDEILDKGLKIMEVEIIDILLPNLKTELLMIGQSKGKFGGGKRSIWRQTQKKTREGNKPKFAAFAVVGNKKGYVGIGFAKAKETVPAREKALRKAKLNLMRVSRGCGSWQCGCKTPHSVPFTVVGKCSSVTVELKPAPKGTGLKAEKEVAKVGGGLTVAAGGLSWLKGLIKK